MLRTDSNIFCCDAYCFSWLQDIVKGRVSWKISNIIKKNNIVALSIKSSYKCLQFFLRQTTE